MPNLTKLLSGLFNPSQTNYSNMQTCLEDDDEQLDGNVTYNQAECMEQNCGINYPKYGPTRGALTGRARRQTPNFPESSSVKQFTGVKLFPKFNERMQSPKTDLFQSYPEKRDYVYLKPNLEQDGDLKDSSYETFPGNKVQPLVVINGTEYLITRQNIFFCCR
ncbi:hypothetical protein TNIN_308191 [Trichonephila inaurata madagascariensis]|uniref:Uncharacterized protein n=1 Tax=Trichonephila inaurata madagascariensis TaxID=2747483 RepID=A0A8X6YHD3_9ARAC|nr:hypothetical protein TNIN_308191 [Trichonephila inaurata madagascariensis]